MNGRGGSTIGNARGHLSPPIAARPGAVQSPEAPYSPAMHGFLTVLIGLLLLATLGVLVAGMVGMVRGGDPHRSNRLMRWRVILQGAALLLLALMMSMLRS
jgi:hypothetical protein